MLEKLDKIYLTVEVGYSIDNVAKAYIEAFNKSGPYMATKYEWRRPTDQELSELQKSGEIQNNKKVFVLVITEYKKIPDNLFKLRPVDKDFKVKVPKDEE